MRTENR